MLPCVRTRRTVPRSPGCRRDTGNVYVVFELSESADPPRANREIFVKRSTEGGETTACGSTTTKNRVEVGTPRGLGRRADNDQLYESALKQGSDSAHNLRRDATSRFVGHQQQR